MLACSKTDSWSTTLICERSDLRVYSRISWPPIRMLPSVGSYSREISETSVDLPPPVGPTMAVTFPAGIVRSIPLSTGRPGSYSKLTLRNST